MNRRLPFLTGTLIAMNVIVFIVFSWRQDTVMFSTVEDNLFLFWTGANFNPFTLGGEPWRLITSMFMHGNIIHIAMNMFALFMIGKQLENDEGHLRFILIYFITGIVAGMASLTYNLFTPGVGASGAIFGLFGYGLVREMVLQYRDRDALLSLFLSFVGFVGINILATLLIEAGPFNMVVDITAHIGGLLCGALLAVAVNMIRFNKLVILAIALVMSVGVIWILPKDQRNYYRVFQALLAAEDHQTSMFGHRLTDEQYADSLRVMISEWQVVIDSLNHLPAVPAALQRDTAIIGSYLHLRRDLDVFQVLEIDKESYVYEDSIEIVHARLDTLAKIQYVLNFKVNPPAIAQEQDQKEAPVLQDVVVYYDSNWRETAAYSSVYYREGKQDEKKRWQGKVRDYYADGGIQMKGAYLDGMDHGIFRYYSPDQKYESAGRYDHDEAVGKWEYFHRNGKLHREIVYANRVFIRNVYDTAGNLQVSQGNGREVNYYHNGQIEEEGEIVNGWRQGLWKGYYADGKPFFEEFYRNNQLVQGKSVDRKGNRFVYDHTSFFAYPVIGIEKYQQYLQHNRRKPSLLIKEGRVRVNFTVDSDGTTKDFVIAESLCAECDDEAIRLIKEGPAWRPALNRGSEKVSSKTSVDVNF
jgi:membrane associated rhomboid family serine protease/antitoxin component YwqK of YwqJK toxin-antitoxin module